MSIETPLSITHPFNLFVIMESASNWVDQDSFGYKCPRPIYAFVDTESIVAGKSHAGIETQVLNSRGVV